MPITVVYMSRLPGVAGSRLEITLAYPDREQFTREDVLKITLPMGAEINSFFENQIAGESIVVYTFHIPNENARADLASIGMVYQKPTNKHVLKDVILELFKFLHDNKLVTVDILKDNIPKIVDAINNEARLTIQAGKKKHTFDIPAFIKRRNDEIVKPLKDLWS